MRFEAYEVALELLGELVPVVEQLRRHSADLADQLERAGTSLVLNLGEGSRRRGKDPIRFFAMAAGSASEIRAALDVARVWRWATLNDRVLALLDRELAMLWRLTHPRPSR